MATRHLLVMSALFIPEGFKELVNEHFNWAWEGANYVTFPLPILVSLIVTVVLTTPTPYLNPDTQDAPI